MFPDFETSRLSVFEVSNQIPHSLKFRIINRVPDLLTPEVVAHLPPHFSGITSPASAAAWFERMVCESRLFVVEHKDAGLPIGFLFAHSGSTDEAHIGYLLAESHWGQGLAGELLAAFVALARQQRRWVKLIGGVESSNHASVHLLTRLGFVARPATDGPVVFYELPLP